MATIFQFTKSSCLHAHIKFFRKSQARNYKAVFPSPLHQPKQLDENRTRGCCCCCWWWWHLTATHDVGVTVAVSVDVSVAVDAWIKFYFHFNFRVIGKEPTAKATLLIYLSNVLVCSSSSQVCACLYECVCLYVCVCVHLTDVSVIKQNFRQSIKFAAAHTRQSCEQEEAQTERGRQRVVPKGKSVKGEGRGRIYIFTTYKQCALAFYAFAFCCIKTERVLMQQPPSLQSLPSSTRQKRRAQKKTSL